MSEETKAGAAKKNMSKELKQKVELLEAQNQEYLDKLLRLKAEFDNYKKRMIREQSQAVKYAAENIIYKLLPIVDDLDRAILAIADGQEHIKVIEGVKLTHKDIKRLLEEHLVNEIDPHGEPFNPEEHEAVLTVDSDEHEEDCVVAVLQKGYKLDGRVVRPAKVSICKKQ